MSVRVLIFALLVFCVDVSPLGPYPKRFCLWHINEELSVNSSIYEACKHTHLELMFSSASLYLACLSCE